ncbi:MAG: acetyl-CoA carboxylase biotin carboxylase subunit [candidate division WOR-3 bacterium]|nr:acetyl-CoA carboxylase biotin carboxylase subunit [candidate division WOR-3 bacterium]
MIKRVLIANRGEIAVRIIYALKELGIESVAVYSEADENSLHVMLANYAIRIGPPASKSSYLNMKNIISAAEISGADAIHPGYGFLAENPEFAEMCRDHNITFIGPPPEAIRAMGDKIEAKRIMKKAGVPVVPGSDDPISSLEEGLSIAKEIGFPIIIKAAAGGGGRGMRLVRDESEFTNAFLSASNEALNAFGDARVYIEKYLEKPRHIEIQLLGDMHGNMVYLGERECSIQRRHQKIIEEALSPALSEEKRRWLGEVAVKGAKAIGYYSAGTMEFLMDKDGNIYFIEMNTRIQVEHPVSEMITGIDIVKEMILIAMGEKLRYKQEDIKFNGHSIEARITAEDPERNFTPTAGKIDFVHKPGGPGIRVDSHIYSGYSIPPYYDSLIAKLIVWDKDRISAISRLKRALEEFVIRGEGIKTTIPLHLKIIEDERFKKGDIHTGFIESILKLDNI